MLQRLDTPILSLNTPAHVTNKDTGAVHADGFWWSVFKKCANSLEKDRRQENLNWRLWRRESGQDSTHTSSSSLTIDVGHSWSNCSSYASTPSANTLLNETFSIPAPKRSPDFAIETPIHADQQQGDDTKDWQLDGVSDDEEDEDDDMTLFGDDTHWSCCEFRKTPPPVVDQRSLLSNMLLQCRSSRAGSSSSSSQPIAPPSSPPVFIEKDDLLSSSMKRYVQWEKKQNSGPAAGLMAAPCPSLSSFMIHRDSFDTFRGCW